MLSSRVETDGSDNAALYAFFFLFFFFLLLFSAFRAGVRKRRSFPGHKDMLKSLGSRRQCKRWRQEIVE
jgi:hypothetical protein